MVLPGRDIPWKEFWVSLWSEILKDNLLDYASSVAFSAFLAIFPFLLFAVALASLVVDPRTLDTLVVQIRRLVPSQAAELLVERLHALTSGTPPALLTASAVGTVWTASGAVAALTTAFNSAWDVEESRPFWKTRGMAILVTFAAALLVIAASVLAIATPAVAARFGGPFGPLVLWLRWPVSTLIMMSILAFLYYLLPNVEQPFRWITPGSVTATLGWVAASIGFSQYVEHFGRYEVVYGALGSIIVFLVWMWISSLVVLIGAEVNAVLDQLAYGQLGCSLQQPASGEENP
jgi:membrane protein